MFLRSFFLILSTVCEGLLSQGGVFCRLQGMTHGRNPDCDGLPMEFYLRFWSVLFGDLVLVLNSAFASGFMSLSLSASWCYY